MQLQEECPAALTVVPGIQRVNSVRVVSSETDLLRDLRFVPNQNSAEGYAQLAAAAGLDEESNWFGFAARVKTPVPSGVPTHLLIDVTLEKGVSATQLVQNLQQKGIMATGSGDPDGTPNGHHFTFRRLSEGGIFLNFIDTQRNIRKED